MSELSHALAALEGKAEQQAPTPASPEAAAKFRVPRHLLRQPHLRAVALSCHEAAEAASHSPEDFGGVYRFGLALQELASKLADAPADQLTLLQQACSVYRAAFELPTNPGTPSTTSLLLYNWAVALTDCARLCKLRQPDESRELLTAAASKYAGSLEANPYNPQALNNAGLVLTDLSNLRPPADRAAFSRHAILRFRRAVRLRPDFERAIYNLGTVAYAAACVQQEELLSGQEQPSPLRRVRGGGGGSSSSSASANELVVKGAFAHAAQYIAIAYAMQPGKAVYADSLAVVQRLLPLPHLRAGPLLAVHPATLGGPAESWIRFPVDDIVDARAPCTDPSLPRGTALWLGLASQRVGVYLVAEQQEDAEGWVDAIILLRHLHEQRSLEGLEKALTMAVGKPQRAA